MATKAVGGAPREISGWVRPSEQVSACLPCRIRVDGPHLTHGWTVVLRRKDGPESDAAVFILVHRSPPSAPSDLRLVHVLPIGPTLCLSLNQTPPSPSVSHFQLSARPHITLSIWNATTKVEIRASASDTPRTQALISEIKRLVTISTSQTPLPVQPSWLGYYPHDSPATSADESLPTASTTGSGSIAGSASASTTTLASPISLTTNVSTPMTTLRIVSSVPAEQDGTAYAAEIEPNPLEPSFSRVAYLRRHIFDTESEWSSRQPIKIRTATYNVNDRLPPKDTVELAKMVGEGEEDLLVFGFQEVDLRSHALLISQGASRAEDWKSAILRGLSEKADDYTCIATSQYVGVLMIVFVKKTMQQFVTEVETSERGIGLLGFGGNKAGVAVRLKVHDTTVCFVNSHLAAFAEALDRRRSDYQVLKSGLAFGAKDGAEDVLAVDEFAPELSGKVMGIEDSHALFWLGDLNYRVDAADDAIKRWAKAREWGWILEKDQLKSDIHTGKSFDGYEEGDIGFAPTYKYIHGSSTLDDKRAPAYTDRILWKTPTPSAYRVQGNNTNPTSSLPGSFPSYPANPTGANSSKSPPPTPSPHFHQTVKCEQYGSHEVLWSDHRPVSATYSTEVRVVDVEKRKHAVSEARRKLERLEELWMPALEVERTEVEFGEISYRRQAVQTVVLRNVGRVPAAFAFREPGAGKAICKPYFAVLPFVATVEPAQTIAVRIVAFVDETHVRDLTAGAEMNDVLVLQVKEGKDTFITLSAAFASTIIGLPLASLPSLSSHIRSLPLADRKALGAPRPRQQENGAPATPNKDDARDPLDGGGSAGARPAREVWRLLEYLMERGSGARGLWTKDEDGAGDDDVLDIIEAIDTGSALPSETASAKAVSLALLHILQSLPEPLVPRQWHPFCLEAKSRDEAFACLEGVQGVHTNVLIGLMSVVRLCSISPGPRSADDEAKTEPPEDTLSGELVKILALTIFGPRSEGGSVMGRTVAGDAGGQERFVRLLLEG